MEQKGYVDGVELVREFRYLYDMVRVRMWGCCVSQSKMSLGYVYGVW